MRGLQLDRILAGTALALVLTLSGQANAQSNNPAAIEAARRLAPDFADSVRFVALAPLTHADELAAAIGANKRDFPARFELAQTHFAAGRFTQAMDELLEIVMRDKAWNQEAARKTYVAILTLMAKPAAKPGAAAPAKGALEVTGKAAPSLAADPVVDQ